MKKVTSHSFCILISILCLFSRAVHSTISWSTPTMISSLEIDASEPQVVIDVYGNVTAAWVENNIIMLSYRPFSGSWSIPLVLSGLLATSSSPKLGIDSEGNVTALWIENTCVKSSVIPIGGNFSGRTIFKMLKDLILPVTNALNLPVSTLSSKDATQAVLAVDTSGNAVSLWLRNTIVESSTRISDAWSSATARSASNSTSPHVAVNNNGLAIGTWKTNASGGDTIVTSVLTISKNTWGVNKNVFKAAAALFHNYPKVAIDSSGNASIVWFRHEVLSGVTYLNVQVLGSSMSANSPFWSIPVVISGSGLRNPDDLSITIGLDLNGNAVAAWTNSYNGESFLYESSLKLRGSGWRHSEIVQLPSLYSLGIDLSFAAEMVLMTTMSWDGVSSLTIQSQEMTVNPILQGWSAVNPYSTTPQNGYPKCAISINENIFNAASVWLSYDGRHCVINASVGSMKEVSPPESVSAVQNSTNLSVYTDYYNTVSWTASSEWSVTQYNIFRNGFFCASITSDTFQWIDHNATQNGTVTYGVAAVNSDNVQSAIVSFTLFP